MCVCVCVCVCVGVCVQRNFRVCFEMSARVSMCVCVGVCVCRNFCVYFDMCVRMPVCVCLCVCRACTWPSASMLTDCMCSAKEPGREAASSALLAVLCPTHSTA